MKLWFTLFSTIWVTLVCAEAHDTPLFDKKSPSVNHAKLDNEHVQVAEKFILQNFKNKNRSYDAKVIQNFIHRLEQESQSLKEDLYETEIIERLELDIDSLKKAREKALEQLNEEENDLLFGYQNFLIPAANKILYYTQEQYSEQKIDALVDQFLELYAVYYLPEAPRNVFSNNLNPLTIGKNDFGYRFNKKNHSLPEANNLKVGPYQAEVEQCLQSKIEINQPLTKNQLNQLKDCGFDLSVLDPVSNPLWSPQTSQNYHREKSEYDRLFPTDKDELIFKKIKYSSTGSPKMNAEFKRGDDEYKVKLKFGIEVHTDPIVASLSKMIGMHQDPVQVRDKVRLYLDDMSVEAFIAQWERKYKGSRQDIQNFMAAKSNETEPVQWVELRDVLMEVRPPNKVRLEGYHPWGWDLPNRREHRAQILWYGLVNLIDSKAGNHKVNLVERDHGYEVEYSFQDVGLSLHANTNLKNPLHVLRWAQSWGVNTFGAEFLSYNEESVRIWWQEIILDKEKFNTTTYNDIKWMARKIARIPYQDLKYAVRQGKLPHSVTEMYIHKLANRRNQMVKAFDLEDEFELFYVPDLKTYSPNKEIQNGEVIVENFEGHTNFERPRLSITKWSLQFLSALFPTEVIKKNFQAKVTDSLNAGVSLSRKHGHEKRKSIDYTLAKQGVNIDITRSVSINDQYIGYGRNDNQAFVIKDKVAISLDLTSSFGKSFLENLPVRVDLDLKVWKREYEYIHYASNWTEGLTSELKLWKFFFNMKNAIIDEVKENEALKIEDSYGISLKAFYDNKSGPLKLGAGLKWLKSSPVYIGRDSFSELYVYKEKSNLFSAGLDLSYGNINLLFKSLPIIGLSFTYGDYSYDAQMYRFKLDKYHLSRSTIDQLRQKREKKALEKLLQGESLNISSMARKEFDVQGEGAEKQRDLSFLLIFNDGEVSGESDVTVTLKTGRKEKFKRSFIHSEGYIGRDDITLFLNNAMLTIKQKKGHRFNFESRVESLDDAIGLFEYTDYDRKKSRAEVLEKIAQLNNLFSKPNSKKGFFRNFLLPSQEEVPVYRKIYTHIRVFMDIKKIAKKLVEVPRSQYQEFYEKLSSRRIIRRFSTGLRENKTNTYRSFVKHMDRIKDYGKNNSRSLTSISYVMNALNMHKNGTSKIVDYFGEESIFVMGELYGIYPSFTTLQQKEAVAGRRFAGKSWGEYAGTPPIRKFLRDHKVTAKNIHLDGGSYIGKLFGKLPSPDGLEFW